MTDPGYEHITAHSPLVRRATAPGRFARRLMRLPPKVAVFIARARFAAWRLGDDAPKGALRPDDLAVLLRLARGRTRVVELGTSKAWTAVSLALADSHRTVTSYDPVVQSMREEYVKLVPGSVRDRIRFIAGPGEGGPPPGLDGIDLLFIDASHEREPTIREYEVWQPFLTPDALIVFDDFGHPDFPGVGEAVDHLGLDGRAVGLLFIHARDTTRRDRPVVIRQADGPLK